MVSRAQVELVIRPQWGFGPQKNGRPQDGDLPSAFGDSGDSFKFDSLLISKNKTDLFRYKSYALLGTSISHRFNLMAF